jgi:hypothetical protein
MLSQMIAWKRGRRTSGKRSIAALLLALSFGLGAGPFAVTIPAVAQSRGPVQRTVMGKVVNKDGAGIKGAIVYLEDDHTSSVKTAIADEEGNFRFVQLASNTDYTVWAKVDGKKSATKGISSFDSRNSFTLSLKID